ncbi:cobD/Cbib family protein [Mycobacterium kansasii]|uniref:Cobalamin biosynthesis protein CobD n=1 Tax=Mycobacterium kansasii TaxID=1768 RepID=A0A1V3WZ59_MYCKA|nr:cobD/Cbib family protein [Mycobacterium kansasii]
MVASKRQARIAGVLVGYLADLALGDPKRGHPVAVFGQLAAKLEQTSYRDSKLAGMTHVGALVGAVACWRGAAARSGQGAVRRGHGDGHLGITGGMSLARTGRAMAELLECGDLEAARRLLPSLCGRDPGGLDLPGLTRAALESVAENTSDAEVAPLLWATIGGAPAVLIYRAVNTLDSMVGYRSPRYLRFGWAAARLDDVANYAGARATAMLVVLCAPLAGGSPLGALRAWRRDAAHHPSPNAGVVEAAFAGALGVRLGGPPGTRRAADPATLGDGRQPTVADLRRAVLLSRAVQAGAAVGVGLMLYRRRP